MKKEWEKPSHRGCWTHTIRAGARHSAWSTALQQPLTHHQREGFKHVQAQLSPPLAGPHSCLMQHFWPFSLEQQILNTDTVWTSGSQCSGTAHSFQRGASLTCSCIWDYAVWAGVSKIMFH